MMPPAFTTPTPSRAQLVAALSVHGLQLRGGWLPGVDDALPSLPGGQAAKVVWMVGVTGSGFWPFFKASSFYQDGQPDPLDRWSHAIGNQLAGPWGGMALFPFDGPPYHPFQQWATRAEPLQTSPLMLRIHPDFGLWHAYRFALALPAFLPGDLSEATPAAASPDLCLSCTGQPCLSACPVQAFTGAAYLLEACATHLHAPDGADCMQSGCLARRACPVGRENTYISEHAAFHMQAFTLKH
jgi:ferredoxin